MAWPQATDYYDAVQNPRIAFKDADLRAGRPDVNTLGMPMPRSGNFADVYEMHSADAQRSWAVKCFTRDMPDRERRFAGISHHLERRQLPFMVDFRYLADGILIGGVWFPVVKMRWIEGQTLNEFVKTRADKPQTLLKLAALWRKLAIELRDANIAHGDLQHGNVLLVETGAGKLGLKLLDYDGMYVPTLANIPSGEVGHPNYQHPQRVRDGIYNFEVDRFAHLVIYLALRAVAASGDLWQRYDNGDNLLFREADFTNPAGSPLLRELLRSPETAVQTLAAQLLLAADGDIRAVPLLTDVVREDGTAAPLRPEQVQELRNLLARGGPARVVPTMSGPVSPGAVTAGPSWLTTPPPVRAALSGNVVVTSPQAIVTAPSSPPPLRTRPPRKPRQRTIPVWARILLLVGPLTIVSLGSVAAYFAFGRGNWFSSRTNINPVPPVTKPSTSHREGFNAIPTRPPVSTRSAPEPKKPSEPTADSKEPIGGQFVASFNHTRLDGLGGTRIWGVFFLDDRQAKPDRQAASIGEDGTIRFWNLETKFPGPLMNVRAFPNEAYRSAALSHTGNKIILACDQGLAEVGWRELSLERMGYSDKLPATVVSDVAYLRTGAGEPHYALAGGHDGLRRWDVRQKKVDLQIGGYHAPFVIVRTGEVVFTEDKDDNAAPVMCRPDMSKVRTFSPVAGPLTHLAIDAEGTVLLGSSSRGVITLWDIRTGDMIRQMSAGSNVTVLAVDPRGQRGLSAGDDGRVHVWKLGSNDSPIVLTGHTGAVRAAAFSPDGRQILTGGDDSVLRLWRLGN